MKIILICFLSMITISFPDAKAGNDGDEITGIWLTHTQTAKVTIFGSGKYYYGKITWLKEHNRPDGKPKYDEHNPDSKLKSRPIFGLLLLSGFEYDANSKQWINGEIYDPKNGKTYSCKLTLTDKNTLEVRGYVGISLIGRTEVWKRSE